MRYWQDMHPVNWRTTRFASVSLKILWFRATLGIKLKQIIGYWSCPLNISANNVFDSQRKHSGPPAKPSQMNQHLQITTTTTPTSSDRLRSSMYTLEHPSTIIRGPHLWSPGPQPQKSLPSSISKSPDKIALPYVQATRTYHASFSHPHPGLLS